MTGTPDAVELTDDEYEQLAEAGGAHVKPVVESIVASHIRASRAQAWDEGATHLDREWQHSEYNAGDGEDFWDTDLSANPYRLEAVDEFQDSED